MADDISLAKSSQFRVFVQQAGSSPVNPYVYVGCLSLGGFQQDLGTGDPIYCPSSEVRGAYDIVDTTAPPPALPTTDFTQHMGRNLQDFWWDLRRRRCKFNMAVVGSNCASPDDINDFQSKILVKSVALTAFNTGAFNTTDADAVIDLTGSLLIGSFDRFLPMTFGEKADTSVFAEALDGIFADKIQCGDCGDPSDGAQKLYVLTSTIAASPALSSQLVHSKNGGSTWATDDITTLTTKAGSALANVGTRIVVVSNADLAHHYKTQAALDANTAGSWSRVSSGYVTAKGPNAIYSKSPSETYIAANGGYIYFMSNPTAAVTVLTDGSVTVQNLNDIRGKGRTIVAVGASNAVVLSENGGSTWSLVTGPAVGIALKTIEVVTPSIWFVGTANGKLFYTTNKGVSWTENTPDSAITVVDKIRFVDELVGYMAVETSGTPRIYRTSDNGYSWFYDQSYVGGVPSTATRYNFVIPAPKNYNVVLAGGLKSIGTDGILAMGAG